MLRILPLPTLIMSIDQYTMHGGRPDLKHYTELLINNIARSSDWSKIGGQNVCG